MAFSASLMMRLLRSGPAIDAVEGLAELGAADDLLVAAGGQDGRLVDDVGQVGAAEAGRGAGDRLEVERLVERLAPHVHAQDLQAPLHVGPVEDDLAVEAARPQEGRVEHVGPVGGGHHDHVGVRVEAVHLDEDLVERLLALVVRAAQTGAALPARPRRSRRRTRCRGCCAWPGRRGRAPARRPRPRTSPRTRSPRC